MKKKIMIFTIILVALSFLALSGCIIQTGEDKTTTTTTYGNGLTGNWTANYNSSISSLIIENEIGAGSTIDSVRYYINPTEPTDWSLGTTLSVTPIQFGNAVYKTIQIGNGQTINTGAAAAATIWIRVTNGNNYLVGSFYYDTGSNTAKAWWLTVYAKK
jgi:hypothetical protein